MLGIFAVIAVGLFIYMSLKLEKHSDRLTKAFTEKLNVREQK